MDTRSKKAPGVDQNAAIQKVDEEQYIIQPDLIKSDATYREAVIYNLVHKLNHLDVLDRKYSDKLNQIETFPAWIKFYVHIPYLVPTVAIILGYMRYKKVLGTNSAMAVICGASFLNEMVKSIKKRKLDKELSKEYDEYARNYRYLMGLYSRTVPMKSVFRYILGVRIEGEMINWRSYYENEKVNNDFLQGVYY